MIIVECSSIRIDKFRSAIEILVDKLIACPTATTILNKNSYFSEVSYFSFFTDRNNYAESFNEIFDVIELSYSEYQIHKARKNTKIYSADRFCEEIEKQFNTKLNNKMPNNLISTNIPIEIAKEMYKSENKAIHDYILTIYKESELKDPPYAKYKTVQDVVGYTDMINSTGPNFLTCLREKLNEGIKINYLKDPIYIPIIKVVENRYANNYLEEQIREKFSIMGKQYCLVTGTKNEYIPINGLFNIQKENSVGAVSLHCGYLAFASVDIAMHAAKYFSKEIFEATMWGHSKDIVIKWLMND